MNKVMTRTAQRRPGTHPPARRDPRRPGTAPTRTPSRGNPGTRQSRTPRGATTTAPLGTAASAPIAVPSRPRPTDLFADRLLAVLSGHRPVHWMLRHTVGRAYDDLARLAEDGPLRTRGARPVVRDIGYYVPRAGAIEVFARIAAGDRLRALAFRLEQGPDLRWRCTAVEVGGPREPREDR
ncbi:Rv3235 family protein [Streptomyces sp. NPDC026672]|uniref:Rv3235 family protein n=1 Tax=unclassified Streptomyces TaxID=2593676 RepID=UPI0033DD2E2B